MRIAICPFAAAVVTGLAVAQQVTVTTTPVTTYSVTADNGGQVTTSSLPAGVPTPFGSISTGQPGGAWVVSSWNTFESEHSVGVSLGILTEVGAAAPGGSALKNASDIVLEFHAPTLAPCWLYAEQSQPPWGNADISWGVDVDDDGVFEFSPLTGPLPGGFLSSRTLGPQPLRVRISSSVAQLSTGSSSLNLRVWAVPSNALQVSPALPGCESQQLELMQSFRGRGLSWHVASPTHPIVGVIGLDLQPLFLPPLFPTPCLLLPSLDLLVLLPSGAPDFHLPLPQAIRPVTFWTQGVSVLPNGLGTTNAFQVDAF